MQLLPVLLLLVCVVRKSDDASSSDLSHRLRQLRRRLHQLRRFHVQTQTNVSSSTVALLQCFSRLPKLKKLEAGQLSVELLNLQQGMMCWVLAKIFNVV